MRSATLWPFKCYVCGYESVVYGMPLKCPQCTAHVKERNRAALKTILGRNMERTVEHMARTQIAANVRERLVNRLAVLLMSAHMGNTEASTRINQTVWTLETIGFDSDLVESIQTDATVLAGVPATLVQTGPDRTEPEGPAAPTAKTGRPVTPAPKPA